MSKPLQNDAVFTLPYDEPTEDGLQAAWRWHFPAGTDRRRVKREIRKVLRCLGIHDYHRVILELGWAKYV